MHKLKQKSSVWLIKKIWSPQATWTEICDFFLQVSEQISGLSGSIFKGLFIKGRINFHILLQKSKILGALQNPGSNSKPLRAATPSLPEDFSPL